MKCFLILIFCTLLLWCSSAVAQTHSLFSGNCNPNNTVTLYEQTIVLKNPNPGSLYKQPPPARRWYDVFSRFSFRRRSTVHQLYNSGPILNATIIFPPNVRTFASFYSLLLFDVNTRGIMHIAYCIQYTFDYIFVQYSLLTMHFWPLMD